MWLLLVAGKLQEHPEVFLTIPGFAPSLVKLLIGIFIVAFPAFRLSSSILSRTDRWEPPPPNLILPGAREPGG